MLYKDNRKTLMAKIHIAKKELALDDISYRALLQSSVGQSSCSQMSVSELHVVLASMKQKGFVPKPTRYKAQKVRKPTASKAAYLAKITALLTHYHLPQSYANGIAQKAFGVQFVHWLEGWQLKKVIQMLAVYDHRQKKK